MLFIHMQVSSYVQACFELILEQGYEEPVGMAKITPAYNLPSAFVIHTVGPKLETK